ncbi:hypothetical protein L596_018483 [Steinernema carpocapsae]|uniref:LIM zinc-binding domain-containing protein n=1 Tax=Steinernema carpocapsae TaxID=34508 RepID=A0A4U5N4T6_STECR|nr:hypothetical protein L596_018483 [Steinernema carpocapsae]
MLTTQSTAPQTYNHNVVSAIFSQISLALDLRRRHGRTAVLPGRTRRAAARYACTSWRSVCRGCEAALGKGLLGEELILGFGGGAPHGPPEHDRGAKAEPKERPLHRGITALRAERREEEDLEPIYQEQTTRSTRSPSHGLDHLEQMLDEYSEKRKSRDTSERPGSAVGGERRPSVHSLMHQLDENSSRRSLGPQGYGASNTDLRLSPSRDPSQLDSMINTLNSDMSKHGISTIPKGDCASCNKPIIGQVVIALGKMWHPEHYVCCQCGEELGHRNFFERGGKAYCEDDYHNMFSPRCGYCNGAIKDRCITALGKTFHPEHFVCAECGHEFGDEGFHEKDGRAYCKSDYFALFAPKCHGCRNAIKINFITALGTHWHPECFVCQNLVLTCAEVDLLRR